MSISGLAAKPFSLAALFALLLMSCARMGVPPGGPEDDVAPTVVSTTPNGNEVNVARDAYVILEFSEPVNRASVESSLYLSPEPGRRLRYRWSGRTLTLDYLDPLPENRTIVVTVGAQAKDLRGIPADSSFTLAFSTSDKIDRGVVRGRVAVPADVRTMTVTAYLLRDSLPDPMRDAPDYRIQTTSQGEFELGYLAEGRYRLFALDDRNMDGLWSPASEWIGTANADVNVLEGERPYVTFLPSWQDTTSLALLRVRHADSLSLDIRVNRPDVLSGLRVSDAAGELELSDWIVDSSASGSWKAFLTRGLQGDSATCVVQCVSESAIGRFAVVQRADTTRPALLASSPANRSNNRAPFQSIQLEFSEPVTLREQTDSVSVVLKRDTLELPVTISQLTQRRFDLQPDSALLPDKRYTLTVPGSLIVDRSGNRLRDSLLTLSWYDYPADSLGVITGVIRSGDGGPWIVNLYDLKASTLLDSVTSSGPFSFSGWPGGDYRLRVTQDVNGNGRPDAGSVLPFGFSEAFLWHPDSINVRPRWTNEIEFLWSIGTQP